MTEIVSQRFSNFDQWTTRDMVEAMFEGQLAAMTAIKNSLANIAVAANEAAKNLGKDGRLVYVGAGTSGRLAVQDGAELGPTFGWPSERTVFCIAGGTKALTVSAEGAEDIFNDGVNAMHQAQIGPNDIVFCVSASGMTPYTLGALKQANKMEALTIGIANNPDTPILIEARHSILADTGSELIAGSTRMKAGTTQKVILNMLSTAIMSKLGRVYKGYMIDMVVSNEKLESRAIKMISDITNCSPNTAKTALKQSGLHIKTAVLISCGQSLSESKKILEQSNQDLRTALNKINSSPE